MEKTQKYIHENKVTYGDYSGIYPEDIMRKMRAKKIIAPNGAIKHDEILFGTLEIDVGAEYPPHRYEAPELYYVLAGEVECLFGAEHFVARKGTVIQTAPNEVHSLKILDHKSSLQLHFGGHQTGIPPRLMKSWNLYPIR